MSFMFIFVFFCIFVRDLEMKESILLLVDFKFVDGVMCNCNVVMILGFF